MANVSTTPCVLVLQSSVPGRGSASRAHGKMRRESFLPLAPRCFKRKGPKAWLTSAPESTLCVTAASGGPCDTPKDETMQRPATGPHIDEGTVHSAQGPSGGGEALKEPERLRPDLALQCVEVCRLRAELKSAKDRMAVWLSGRKEGERELIRDLTNATVKLEEAKRGAKRISREKARVEAWAQQRILELCAVLEEVKERLERAECARVGAERREREAAAQAREIDERARGAVEMARKQAEEQVAEAVKVAMVQMEEDREKSIQECIHQAEERLREEVRAVRQQEQEYCDRMVQQVLKVAEEKRELEVKRTRQEVEEEAPRSMAQVRRQEEEKGEEMLRQARAEWDEGVELAVERARLETEEMCAAALAEMRQQFEAAVEDENSECISGADDEETDASEQFAVRFGVGASSTCRIVDITGTPDSDSVGWHDINHGEGFEMQSTGWDKHQEV